MSPEFFLYKQIINYAIYTMRKNWRPPLFTKQLVRKAIPCFSIKAGSGFVSGKSSCQLNCGSSALSGPHGPASCPSFWRPREVSRSGCLGPAPRGRAPYSWRCGLASSCQPVNGKKQIQLTVFLDYFPPPR